MGSGEASLCELLRVSCVDLAGFSRFRAGGGDDKEIKNDRCVSCSPTSHNASLLIALDLKGSKLIPKVMYR